YWLNAVLLDPEFADDRDALLATLHDTGILCRPAWTPMHRLAMYRDCPRAALPVAEDLERRLITLPSGPRLAEQQG
ncbi:MAG: DegT/DnrJ/EryC1/StrS family aminotransferase, partial [Alphaproteobacteria bacterium]